jgi:hypothetical protein
LEYLIAKRCSVNLLTTKTKFTPLQLGISMKSNFDVLRKLIENEADLFCLDFTGRNALEMAMTGSRPGTVDFLAPYYRGRAELGALKGSNGLTYFGSSQ